MRESIIQVLMIVLIVSGTVCHILLMKCYGRIGGVPFWNLSKSKPLKYSILLNQYRRGELEDEVARKLFRGHRIACHIMIAAGLVCLLTMVFG